MESLSLWMILMIFKINVRLCRGGFIPVCNDRICIFSNGSTILPGSSSAYSQDCMFPFGGGNLNFYNEPNFSLLDDFIKVNSDINGNKVYLSMNMQSTSLWIWLESVYDYLFDGSFDNEDNAAAYGYVAIDKSSISYRSTDKNDLMNVLCSDDCSHNISNVWKYSSTGPCYYPVYGSLTWYQAQNECYRRNGRIASFFRRNMSAIAPEWFESLQNSNYWIGLTKGRWTWTIPTSRGKLVEFSNWMPGYPEEPSEDKCVYFVANVDNNQWRTGSCEDNYTVVCTTSSDKAAQLFSFYTTPASSTDVQTSTRVATTTLFVRNNSTPANAPDSNKGNVGIKIGINTGVVVTTNIIMTFVACLSKSCFFSSINFSFWGSIGLNF